MSWPIFSLIGALVFIGSIFLALPRAGQSEHSSLNHSTHSLLLFAAIAFIPMFALVEMSGRYGITTLLAMIVFGLLDMLSPVILRPIQWFTRRHNIAGVIDILAYRFRGQRFGQLATVILIVTALPLAFAMLQGICDTLSVLLGSDQRVTSWLGPLLIIIITLAFLWREQPAAISSHTLVARLSVASLFIIASLSIATLVIVYEAFGGITEMNQWVDANRLYAKSLRLEYGPALIAAFFGASIALPQFYSLRATARSEKTIGRNSWLFPLLLLMGSLPMLPLLWSGIVLGVEIPLQMYAATLAAVIELPVVATLTVTAALIAGITGLAILTISLAQPITNYLLMPRQPDFATNNIYHWLGTQSRKAYSALLALILLGFFLISRHSITDLILVAFTGLSQLAPAVLTTFYFPNINRRGVTWGMTAGFTLWFVGLFLPLFVGNWTLDAAFLPDTYTLGMANWNTLFYEALFLNISLCVSVSLFTTMSDREKYFANECMVDNLPQAQRIKLNQHSIGEFRQNLELVLGAEVTSNIVEQLQQQLAMNSNEDKPIALRLFHQQLIAQLNGLVGPIMASKLVEQALPVLSRQPIYNNVVAIENLAGNSGPQLSGLTAELNNLRLYHRKALQQLPVGICTLDEGGEIITWNQTIDSFTGISQQQAQGALISQLPAPWRSIFERFLEQRETVQHAIEISINNQTHWCTLHKAVVDSSTPEQPSSQVLLLEDVTELMTLSRSLMHSDRLASVGRLAAGVAHEIGNPVTGIACLAQDIQHEDNPQEIRSNAASILEQTQRITNIVQSLTSFSRSKASPDQQLKPVNVSEALQEAITLLELRNDKQLNFVVNADQLDSSLPTVLGDQHQLTQVFLNLLTNAYDASPTAGSITTQLGIDTSSSLLIIRIADEGPGIDKTIRDLVFDPFFTTKGIGSGTGLGLSLVYDIIRLHNGSIQITDSDVGTCMEIQLPVSR